MVHLLYVVSLFLSALDMPPDSANLAGWVKDAETGKPVPFCTVAIPGRGVGTHTDTSGYFSFIVPDSLLNQELQVAFGYVGYDLATFNFHAKNLPLVLDVTLHKKKITLIAPMSNPHDTLYVEGYIKDRRGYPIQYASVSIPDLKLGMNANAEGYYRIAISESMRRQKLETLQIKKVKLQYGCSDCKTITRKVSMKRIPRRIDVSLPKSPTRASVRRAD